MLSYFFVIREGVVYPQKRFDKGDNTRSKNTRTGKEFKLWHTVALKHFGESSVLEKLNPGVRKSFVGPMPKIPGLWGA